MDVVLRESEKMLSQDMEMIGPKNAARIWGFVSKFVMLDRFIKALGLAELLPGFPVERTFHTEEHFGKAAKVSFSLQTS